MNRLELSNEKPIAFSEIPKLLPKRRGKKIHYSTVYRWATKGVRGRVLESQLIGGVRYTTMVALHQFLETTNIQARMDHDAAALRRIMYGEQA